MSQKKEKNPYLVHEEEIDDLIQDTPTTTLLAFEGDNDWYFCSKLCSEYEAIFT